MPITSVTLTGTYYEQNGSTPATGSVTVVAAARRVHMGDNKIVEPIPVTSTLVGGTFSLAVPASDSAGLSPSDVYYTITETITGAPVVSYSILVPANTPGGVIDLADVSPIVVPAPLVLVGLLPEVVKTASYTLALDDMDKVVAMNVATANNLTIPPNSSVAFPVGAVLEVFQLGAGQTTLVAGSGVTIRSEGAKLKVAGQYGSASLRKRATDEWVAAGSLTT